MRGGRSSSPCSGGGRSSRRSSCARTSVCATSSSSTSRSSRPLRALPRTGTSCAIELAQRLRSLEEECASYRERLLQVEEENRQFVERYLEIEEENNNLANLYVASYQLHSTLDLDEVLKIIVEIVINLIGAEVFAVYLFDGNSQELAVAASEGLPPSAFPKCALGSGPLGKAVASTETTCWDTARSDDLRQPIVCIPLAIQKRPIGAIAIHSLLQQKNGFTAARPRAVHAARRPRRDGDLRGATLLAVRAQAEHDPGVHRPAHEVTRVPGQPRTQGVGTWSGRES